MPVGDSLSEFRELRMFAMDAIPRMLKERGGSVSKVELHRSVEDRFSTARGGWPRALDGTGASGCRRGTNAIAWALATLTSRMVIHPCLGSDVVRLRGSVASRGVERIDRATRKQASSGHEDKLEAVVRERARQAMRRAESAGLPFDESFVTDSVRAVRRAGYRCAITGRPFDIEFRTAGAGGTHYGPSPDRTIPEQGYVRGNVRWVLWCLNRGKGEMSAEDYFEMCRLVANYKTPTRGALDAASPEVARLAGWESPSQPQGYTVQQLAAYKAHATMLRRSLDRLSGGARLKALQRLAYYESLLATASATSSGSRNG